MIGAACADKMCLVLSVVAQPSPASRQGNSFGIAFKEAAEDTEAQTEHDGFDSSVMRVSWIAKSPMTPGRCCKGASICASHAMFERLGTSDRKQCQCARSACCKVLQT